MRVVLTGGLNLAQSLKCMADGFERIGCEVEYVSTTIRDGGGKRFRPDAIKALSSALRSADLLYWWQPHVDCKPEVMEQLRAMAERSFDVPLVMQSLDDPFMLGYWRPDHLAGFDLAVTCCRGSVPWYEERGVRAIVGYPPVDPETHAKAIFAEAKAADFSFVATNVYPPGQFPYVLMGRVDIVRALAEIGTTHVYGYWGKKANDWGGSRGLTPAEKDMYRGWTGYEEQATVYRSTAVNISTHVRPDGLGYLNERVILVTGSGGFLLCDRVAGIEDIFVEDEEIALFGDLDELKEKAAWWLGHPEERAAAAERAQEKTLREHSNVALARRIVEAVTK